MKTTTVITTLTTAAVALVGCATTDVEEPVVSSEAQMTGVQVPLVFQTVVTNTMRANYLSFLPKDYDQNSGKKWPMLLFLHGAGERGDDIWQVAKHGPPKIIEEDPESPFICIAPQCSAGEWWSTPLLIALIDHVLGNYAVDPDRVYLTGMSMGGFGAWNLALEHPERFAAVAPICGGAQSLPITLSAQEWNPKPGKHEALKSLPIWAFHGGKDPVINVEESKHLVSLLKELGNKNVELTIYPEIGHDSWTATYNTPKFYEWLLGHRRGGQRKE